MVITVTKSKRHERSGYHLCKFPVGFYANVFHLSLLLLYFSCQRKVSTNVQLAFSEPSTCQYSISVSRSYSGQYPVFKSQIFSWFISKPFVLFQLESPLFCELLKQATDEGLLPPDVLV